MHHKRKGPKDTRAGCLMCKRQKSNANKDSYEYQTVQEQKAIEDEKYQLARLNDEELTASQLERYNIHSVE
jgi:glutaredoxin